MRNLDLRDIPAVYINLAQETERNESMKLVLNDCGFKNIIRVEAKHTPSRPLAGCSISHYNALNEIDPPFIIFEDDCLPHQDFFKYCEILLEKYKDNEKISYPSRIFI